MHLHYSHIHWSLISGLSELQPNIFGHSAGHLNEGSIGYAFGNHSGAIAAKRRCLANGVLLRLTSAQHWGEGLPQRVRMSPVERENLGQI